MGARLLYLLRFPAHDNRGHLQFVLSQYVCTQTQTQSCRLRVKTWLLSVSYAQPRVKMQQRKRSLVCIVVRLLRVALKYLYKFSQHFRTY